MSAREELRLALSYAIDYKWDAEDLEELIDDYRAEVLRDQLAYEKRMKQQHEDDLAKLNAIRALHVPYFGFCDECSDGPAYLISYPCPTVLCLKQEESK